MTREYPPEVYGGAGVHVTELVAQLRRLCEVDVHCMGAPRPGAFVYAPDPALAGANPALSTLSARYASRVSRMRSKVSGVDVSSRRPTRFSSRSSGSMRSSPVIVGHHSRAMSTGLRAP